MHFYMLIKSIVGLESLTIGWFLLRVSMTFFLVVKGISFMGFFSDLGWILSVLQI